jgi:hypothetical protein
VFVDQITIKWEQVKGLERKSTAKIIPNAILVRLKGNKEVRCAPAAASHRRLLVSPTTPRDRCCSVTF